MFYSTGQEGDPYESIIWKSAPAWRNYWHCRTSESLLEPPLSLHGSISTSWIPRFDREIAEGKPASALITFIKGDNLSRLPRWLLLPLLKWYLQREKQTLGPNDVSLEALIPTQRFDGLLVKEMDGSLENFALLRAEVFLLGGAKSPAFLRDILDALNHTLPAEFLQHSLI